MKSVNNWKSVYRDFRVYWSQVLNATWRLKIFRLWICYLPKWFLPNWFGITQIMLGSKVPHSILSIHEIRRRLEVFVLILWSIDVDYYINFKYQSQIANSWILNYTIFQNQCIILWNLLLSVSVRYHISYLFLTGCNLNKRLIHLIKFVKKEVKNIQMVQILIWRVENNRTLSGIALFRSKVAETFEVFTF